MPVNSRANRPAVISTAAAALDKPVSRPQDGQTVAASGIGLVQKRQGFILRVSGPRGSVSSGY
jgi:hypothetical protein